MSREYTEGESWIGCLFLVGVIIIGLIVFFTSETITETGTILEKHYTAQGYRQSEAFTLMIRCHADEQIYMIDVEPEQYYSIQIGDVVNFYYREKWGLDFAEGVKW